MPDGHPHVQVVVLKVCPSGQVVETQALPHLVKGGLQVKPHTPPVQVAVPPAGAAQFTQVPPPLPQAAGVFPGWQVLPEQQPFGQLAGVHLQTPLTQAWPLAQAWQVPPPLPQVPADCDAKGTQVVPEQQPFGQLAGVHLQTPLTQAWPLAQA